MFAFLVPFRPIGQLLIPQKFIKVKKTVKINARLVFI